MCGDMLASGGSGGDHNSGNHGNSDNGGNAGDIRRCGLEFCTAEAGKGGSSNSNNLFSNNGDGIFWPIVLTLVWLWP